MSNKVTYVETTPNAARTLAALRELGYASIPAVCDLVDNSIGAGADHIAITVRQNGKDRVIEIVDDGHGMSRDTLHEAMRFGSDVEKYKSTDLGKYGMGLKSASLSIAKRLWVLTRQKGEQAFEATFDVDVITRLDDWKIELKPATHNVLNLIGDYGTLVRLSSVDRLDDTNVTRFSEKLVVELGRVFRNFIKKGLKITLNREVIQAVDPLMRNAGAKVKFDESIVLGRDKKAHLTIVELPDLGTEQDEAAGIIPQRSGFYVMRNKREIMSAQTFGFYKHHHSYSHFRAELSFTGELDQDFHVDVKKTSITPNDQIVDHIRAVAQKYIADSGREGQERAVAKTRIAHNFIERMIGGSLDGKEKTPSVVFTEKDLGKSDVLFTINRDGGRATISYNQRHPFVQRIASTKMTGAAVLDLLCLALADGAGTKEGDKTIDQLGKALLAIFEARNGSDNWDARDRLAKTLK